MKRIVLFLSLILASSLVNNSWAQGIAIGGRIGSGLQVQAEIPSSQENYFEARFGMSWCNYNAVIMADFTALHQWNVATMKWTPRVGLWYFDAGAGINVGGRSHYAYVGVAGSAKLGIKFHKAPIRLAVDWTPSFGPEIAYGRGWSVADFNELALANFGLSCVYYF